MDSSSKEVTKIIQLINNVVALIPEVVALEKKVGSLKEQEKDHFLDQIIENLRAKSRIGKMWDNAAKAKQESEASMAKDTKEKLEVNDVVNKVLQESGLAKKSKEDLSKTAK